MPLPDDVPSSELSSSEPTSRPTIRESSESPCCRPSPRVLARGRAATTRADETVRTCAPVPSARVLAERGAQRERAQQDGEGDQGDGERDLESLEPSETLEHGQHLGRRRLKVFLREAERTLRARWSIPPSRVSAVSRGAARDRRARSAGSRRRAADARAPPRPRGGGDKSSPTDLVSEADVAAERAIREVIEAERPRDAILGEEGDDRAGDSGVQLGHRSARRHRQLPVRHPHGASRWPARARPGSA